MPGLKDWFLHSSRGKRFAKVRQTRLTGLSHQLFPVSPSLSLLSADSGEASSTHVYQPAWTDQMYGNPGPGWSAAGSNARSLEVPVFKKTTKVVFNWSYVDNNFPIIFKEYVNLYAWKSSSLESLPRYSYLSLLDFCLPFSRRFPARLGVTTKCMCLVNLNAMTFCDWKHILLPLISTPSPNFPTRARTERKS